ncbi:acetyltransferase [Clostridium perfringens]|uniref:acetyltransferase n=1 Tax=Clostridium perfringens TaxID=1502 RepID=UPI0018D74AB5|nr:acetyltransferase [Clostridium perfringens]MDM0695024.1 acetyltransferase [Clostridium perfringens]QPS26167.1 acetyltransferase [Clostridium perfringens]
MQKKLVIIGASGHGKVVADIAKRCGYSEIIFLDDNSNLKECNGYPVVGLTNEIESYPDYEFVVAIGNATIREKFQLHISSLNYRISTLLHPNSVIGENVILGKGTVVMAGAVINSASIIGEGCIINTSSSVDHDNRISDYVHISVGSHLAGTVSVGKSSCIGIGAVVSNNIIIGENCIIGAGAVVIKNIMECGTYLGVPARRRKDENIDNSATSR